MFSETSISYLSMMGCPIALEFIPEKAAIKAGIRGKAALYPLVGVWRPFKPPFYIQSAHLLLAARSKWRPTTPDFSLSLRQ